MTLDLGPRAGWRWPSRVAASAHPGPRETLRSGLRVRMTWPAHIVHGNPRGLDYSTVTDCCCPPVVTDACGVVVSISPCKQHPEFWPVGEFCGYLLGGERDEREADYRRAEFSACRDNPPVVGCQVLWDADFRPDGTMRMRLDYQVRLECVDDARVLTDVTGQPVLVLPLIERVEVCGGVL